MSESADVQSIDALKSFRGVLFKFQESANAALADAEGDLSSTLNWLENEQLLHWRMQIRKRHELLERAREALRMKRLFKDASGRTPTAVEEEKAVRVAQQRMAEAEQKLVNVKKYTRVLQHEIQIYKGSVQRFATTVQVDMPIAAATLSRMIDTLQQYAALQPAIEVVSAGASLSAPETSTPQRIDVESSQNPDELPKSEQPGATPA